MGRALPLLILLALPLAAAAQTYKWKDKNGQVHFTQLPPPGTTPFETVGPVQAPAPAPNQDALNKSLDDSRKTAPEQQKAADSAAAEQAARQDRCKRALERVAYLDARTPRRLATTDAAGQVSRMSEEEFQRRRAEAQQQADQNCS